MTGSIEFLRSRRGKWSLGIGFGVLVIVLPFVLSSFWLGLLTEMFIFGLFALSFNLLFGYTGMLSFGHAAFYGLGAYGVAFALTGQLSYFPQVGSFIPAVVLSVLFVTAIGALAGVICVIRRGIYFAMLTLAVNLLFFTLAAEQAEITGGREGLVVGAPVIDLGVISFSASATQLYYYFVFAIVTASILLLLRIVNSPYGQLLQAIRENDRRMEFVGIPVRRYMWSSFVFSSMFAGLAGALFSVRIFLVNPNILHWSVSAEPVFATLLGGPSTFLGPLFGAFFLVLLEEQLTTFTQFWQFWLGILLIPIVLYFPDGILGTTINYLEGESDD